MKLFPSKEFVIETTLSVDEVKERVSELIKHTKKGFIPDYSLWMRKPKDRTYRGKIDGNTFELYVEDTTFLGRSFIPSHRNVFYVSSDIKTIGNKTIITSKFQVNWLMDATYYVIFSLVLLQLFVIKAMPEAQEIILLGTTFMLLVMSLLFLMTKNFLKKQHVGMINFLTEFFEAK